MGAKRAAAAAAAALGAVMMVGMSAAFACTNLASVNMSRAAAAPGATIDLTAAGTSQVTANTPFQLRWQSRGSAPLATATVDQAGNLSARFTVPDVAPGYYIIYIDPQGLRTRFQVLGAASSTQTAGTPQVVPGLAPEPSSGGVAVLAATIGAFGLGLFGAGFVSVVRESRRRRRVPVTVPAGSR